MPARAPDPHNLRKAAQATAAIIDIDRECAGCGYNLRGLRMGIPCPECGLPSNTSGFGEVDDPLSVAPPSVILLLIRGCWAATIILGLTVALMFAPGISGWQRSWSVWGMLPLSMLWVGAVVWLTPALAIPQAATRGFSRRGRLRQFARQLQWGWVLAAGQHALRIELNPVTPVANLMQFGVALGVIAGVVGAVMLAILMERLANWARDDSAERAFNWAQWTIPICTVVLLTAKAWLMAPGLQRYGNAVQLLWVLGVAVFPYALITLSSSVTLSIVHNYEHRQRGERKAERDARQQENVDKTIRAMDHERARRGHV